MAHPAPDTHFKALQVNLDPVRYGTFAEIGAGQEVARWFFRVGGAAGTVAKAMSAYDMTFSDAIYGQSDRYVSRARLDTMLNHEYALLVERLNTQRGERSMFFVFADTVATRSYSRREDGHGWLGIRFQTDPLGPASDITIHVRLAEGEPEQQQEAIGTIGVNLVYGALFHHAEPTALIGSLLDNVTTAHAEIDMIEFSGPAFAGIDNRLMSLELVRSGLTDAAMFGADGKVVQPSEALYKKCVLVERGSFRPATKVTVDMLRCARAQFEREPGVGAGDVLELFEMTLTNLTEEAGGIDGRDFLDRADILATLGGTVLISKYGAYHRLGAYLFRHTRKPIGLVMGVPTLRELFVERYYADLDGGILESFGRLFKNDVKIYAYPERDATTGALTTAASLQVAPHLSHLRQHLLENRMIESLDGFDERLLSIHSREVFARIRRGEPGWEAATPGSVARVIKRRGLLGYGAAEQPDQQVA
jgi:hypothetical protein